MSKIAAIIAAIQYHSKSSRKFILTSFYFLTFFLCYIKNYLIILLKFQAISINNNSQDNLTKIHLNIQRFANLYNIFIIIIKP